MNSSENYSSESKTGMSGTCSLAIVIPAYNESGRIIHTLYDIDEYISESTNPGLLNVIIVSDGSTDDTDIVVSNWIEKKSKNKKSFILISYSPNKGKGYAIREGFLKSNSDFVLYTDADGASPIKEVNKLLYWTEHGFDVVCGSRIIKADDVKVEMGLKRRFTGLVFHLILKFFNLADVKDTQCGFKLFRKDVVKKLAQAQKCFNYSFDIEYLLLSKNYGYKIKEVPVNWSHVKGSKISLLQDSIKMLLEVLKIRFVYKYN